MVRQAVLPKTVATVHMDPYNPTGHGIKLTREQMHFYANSESTNNTLAVQWIYAFQNGYGDLLFNLCALSGAVFLLILDGRTC